MTNDREQWQNRLHDTEVERDNLQESLKNCQQENERIRLALEQAERKMEKAQAKLATYQKQSTLEREELCQALSQIQQTLRQSRADMRAISFWTGVAGNSEPYRIAHFAVQLKHALLGTPEERAECRRWLKGDRSFTPKFSFLRHISLSATALSKKLAIAESAARRLNAPQLATKHKVCEYKYVRWQNKRNAQFQVDMTKIQVAHTPGMVSVILPVYNGDDMVEESIRSVLAQTHKHFELIVVDDGSTDQTPQIVDRWAGMDKRIRVIHQKNAKLPRALNNGFACARGEFLTWTSADNNMHPDFLEKLVGYMQRNPGLAMCYANIRTIDGEGKPMTDNTWYSRGEHTGNVYLPDATLRLNTYAENTIAAAFMYRRAIPLLLGGYDPQLYTVEDYDYWMRINNFFGLQHVDFDDVIYDYRFHDKSLTSKAKELRISEIRDKLMLMEDFREDWLIRPMCWLMEDSAPQIWGDIAAAAGHTAMTREKACGYQWPKLGTGVVQLTFARKGEALREDVKVTDDAIRVLICDADTAPENTSAYDLLIQVGANAADVPEHWVRAADEKSAFDVIQIFCKAHWFDQLTSNWREQQPYAKKATIVLCTYKRLDAAQRALARMLEQHIPKEDYEILVVNNDPENREMYQHVCKLRAENGYSPSLLRYIDCPHKGLSMARNYSIYEARGGVLLYVDDDGLMASDCLEKILQVFDEHEDVAIAGGQILLKDPERFADVILPGYESIWSERRYPQGKPMVIENAGDFPYGCNYAVRTDVAKELGGFRISYGRVGKDFAGGEELVLSHLARRAGYQVGINPAAIVTHDVEPSRYTLEHVKQTLRAAWLTNRLIKMDMYKPFDLGMQEERAQLESAQAKMRKLDEEKADQDDLRRIYCQFIQDATMEAIRAGEQDIQEMHSF